MGTFHEQAQASAAEMHGRRFYWLYVVKNHPILALVAAMGLGALAVAIWGPGWLSATGRFVDSWGTVMLLVLGVIVLLMITMTRRAHRPVRRPRGRRFDGGDLF